MRVNRAVRGRAVELPLFPLNTVLFPGGHLQLKVFEARYLDMTAECMRNQTPFGVCLIREGGEVGEPAVPESMGTLAQIRLADMMEPGIFQLDVEGGQRFVIESTRVGANHLLIGEVRLKPEESAVPVPKHCRPCLALLEHFAGKMSDLRLGTLRDEAAWVGYRLCERLPFVAPTRQALLELDDTVRRLEIILEYIRRQGWA